MEDLNSLLSQIGRGEIRLQQIGSVTVAKDADPRDAAVAAKNILQAKQLSANAKTLAHEGKLHEASNCLMQSLVIEDSLGNLYGIASDLGNLAHLFRRLGDNLKSLAAYEKALSIDERLLAELPIRLRLQGSVDSSREYLLMRGLHSEGVARCLIEERRLDDARQMTTQALSSYREAQAEEHVQQAQELLAWLLRKLGDPT